MMSMGALLDGFGANDPGDAVECQREATFPGPRKHLIGV